MSQMDIELFNKQLANLESNKQVQIAGYDVSFGKILSSLDSEFVNNSESLITTVTSFYDWLSTIYEHQAKAVIAKIIKETGEGIEVLVKVLKAQTMEMEVEDAALIAEITGPDTSEDFNLPAGLVNSKEAITNFIGELYEQITGIGSDIESIGDIYENAADIIVDLQQIALTLYGLEANVATHLRQFDNIVARLDEAVTNDINTKEILNGQYDGEVAIVEEQLEYLKRLEEQIA
jgi:hypothetical protein